MNAWTEGLIRFGLTFAAGVIGGPPAVAAVTAAITVYDVRKSLREEEYFTAVVDAALGILSIASCGAVGFARSAVKSTAMTAVKKSVESSAKQVSKRIGQETAKEIARLKLKGAARDKLVKAAQDWAKRERKQLINLLDEEISRGLTDRATKQAAKEALDSSRFEITLNLTRGVVDALNTDNWKEALEELWNASLEQLGESLGNGARSDYSKDFTLFQPAKDAATEAFEAAADPFDIMNAGLTSICTLLILIKIFKQKDKKTNEDKDD